MSNALMIALVLLVVTLVFPLLALRLRLKRGSSMASNHDDIVEIKASILFWNTALPSLLLLFGALGFASYDDLIEKVSEKVKTDYNQFINKETIDALVKEIGALRDTSKVYKEKTMALLALATTQSQSMDEVYRSTQANASEIAAIFVKALPEGAIFPYYGLRYDFDKTMWALCDGTNGTPDLRNRFILGSGFENIGSKDGEEQHSHSINLDIDGTVTKRGVSEDSRFGGPAAGGVPFKVEKHEHVFKISKDKANIGTASNMPPFFRLVYLMKIK